MSDAQAIPFNKKEAYPITFKVDYPKKLGRWSTLFRFILAIPIYIWSQLFMIHFNQGAFDKHQQHHVHGQQAGETIASLKATAQQAVVDAQNHTVQHMHAHAHLHNIEHFFFYTSAYVMLPVFLMIFFRRKYPQWIYDFNVGMLRFMQRLMVYMYFMTDKYPNTDQDQAVHVSIPYPEQDTLNRWLPFVKWFLAIPHYICLLVLTVCSLVVTLLSWFAVLFTGRYPKIFFDFNVGVMQWWVRVTCYVGLLITDKYPPFSLS